jgi:hypothetical protein
MSSPESLLEPGEEILDELYDTVLRGFQPKLIASLTHDLLTSTHSQGTLTEEEFESSRATYGSISPIQRTLSCEYSSQLILGFQATNGLKIPRALLSQIHQYS